MTEGIANANVTNPSNIYAINLLPNDAFLWATHFGAIQLLILLG